jgi:serine/threonine protein kinase
VSSPDPLLGRTLDGRYRIDACLGIGGMGTVYRAWHLRLETWRAIKVMKPELAHDADFAARFEREARVIEGLRHPHLVALFDLSQTSDGALYIVYELVEGETLAARQAAQGRFSADEIALLLGQVADGLAFAHAHGVIHRDVSPDNIMIQGAGTAAVAKLLDFGLAKEIVSKGAPLTGSGLLLGKIGYAAPEQMGYLDKGASLDPRADVFSCCAVLYEVLASRLPWATSSLQAYVHDLLIRPEAALKARVEAEIPLPWQPVVLKGLSRNREQRTPDMGCLRSEILDACRRSGRAARGEAPAGIEWHENQTLAPSPPTQTEPAGWRSRRMRRWAWATAAALVAGWLGWSMLSSSRHAVAPDRPSPAASPTPHTAVPALSAAVLPSVAPSAERVALRERRPMPVPTATPSEPGPAASSAPASPAPAELVVGSTPEAEVRLDGEGRGHTPMRLTLPAGRYQLCLLTQDGRRFDESLDLLPGETARRDHRFAEPGSLAISSDPWIEVSIDGGPPRQTPTLIERVPAGTHTIRATRPGWEDIVLMVDIPEGKTRTMRLTPRRLSSEPAQPVQK